MSTHLSNIEGMEMAGKLPEVRLANTPFKVVSPFEPSGDQPEAIATLAKGVEEGLRYQTLLGVTGSGKTFTMAKTIEAVQKPTLVMAPNKTLAAQLAAELKEFFPDNAVVYFVSYYDYYQPEAYVPSSDTFIEKDASINEEVEKLRHAATSALLSRRDVIVVASVSCIYGIGSPMDYAGMAVFVDKQKEMDRDEVIHELIDIQYDRNDYEQKRGTFRVRGDALDVFPPYADHPIRIEFWGDEIESIDEIDQVTGEVLNSYEALPIWPASHYVTARPKMDKALGTIQDELRERLMQFKEEGKLLEAQRLEMRVNYDLEMLETMGFCSGIENYSRHLDGRAPGEPPYTLIDYFPKDFLCIIDESHVTVPQIRGMHEGDRSRKITLAEHGFRLPSCLDNRPLRFDEFEERIPQFIYVSATPGDYEERVSQAKVDQVIRPTGLLDPEIVVRTSASQIDDIIDEAKERAARNERVLITTLTKKMAEDLTDHLLDQGVKARYMHSDIATLERIGDPARSAPRRVRRARGHQPSARGARLARGVARGHPGCRQGGLPAQPPLAHPDHRPRGPQRVRPGHHVRRPHHRFHAPGYRRDAPAPRHPDGLQRGARYQAADHPQGHQRHHGLHHRRRGGHHCRAGEQGAGRAFPRRGPAAHLVHGGRHGRRVPRHGLRGGGPSARPGGKAEEHRGGQVRGRRAEGFEEGRAQGERLRQPQARRLRIVARELGPDARAPRRYRGRFSARGAPTG